MQKIQITMLMLGCLWLNQAQSALSQLDLHAMVLQVQSLVDEVNNTSSTDQKNKLLQQARSILSVLMAHGSQVNQQYSDWQQVSQSKMNNSINGSVTGLSAEVLQLNAEVQAQIQAIENAKQADTAAKSNAFQARVAANKAQTQARKDSFASAANMASAQRSQNLANLQGQMAMDNAVAASARQNWAAMSV